MGRGRFVSEGSIVGGSTLAVVGLFAVLAGVPFHLAVSWWCCVMAFLVPLLYLLGSEE